MLRVAYIMEAIPIPREAPKAARREPETARRDTTAKLGPGLTVTARYSANVVMITVNASTELLLLKYACNEDRQFHNPAWTTTSQNVATSIRARCRISALTTPPL